MEQTRDNVLRYGEVVGCELLNFFVRPKNEMNRITTFLNNAGAQGILSSGIVSIIVLFGLARDFRTGDWSLTLPVLVATLGLPYIIRNLLVEHFSVMRVVMNGLAMAGIAAVVLLPKPVGPEPLWLRATILGSLGTYMGCYFWMLSDDNIG